MQKRESGVSRSSGKGQTGNSFRVREACGGASPRCLDKKLSTLQYNIKSIMRKKIKWALTLFVAILGVTSMAEKQPALFKTELLTHRSRADYENYLNITKNRIAVTPTAALDALLPNAGDTATFAVTRCYFGYKMYADNADKPKGFKSADFLSKHIAAISVTRRNAPGEYDYRIVVYQNQDTKHTFDAETPTTLQGTFSASAPLLILDRFTLNNDPHSIAHYIGRGYFRSNHDYLGYSIAQAGWITRKKGKKEITKIKWPPATRMPAPSRECMIINPSTYLLGGEQKTYTLEEVEKDTIGPRDHLAPGSELAKNRIDIVEASYFRNLAYEPLQVSDFPKNALNRMKYSYTVSTDAAKQAEANEVKLKDGEGFEDFFNGFGQYGGFAQQNTWDGGTLTRHWCAPRCPDSEGNTKWKEVQAQGKQMAADGVTLKTHVPDPVFCMTPLGDNTDKATPKATPTFFSKTVTEWTGEEPGENSYLGNRLCWPMPGLSVKDSTEMSTRIWKNPNDPEERRGYGVTLKIKASMIDLTKLGFISDQGLIPDLTRESNPRSVPGFDPAAANQHDATYDNTRYLDMGASAGKWCYPDSLYMIRVWRYNALGKDSEGVLLNTLPDISGNGWSTNYREIKELYPKKDDGNRDKEVTVHDVFLDRPLLAGETLSCDYYVRLYFKGRRSDREGKGSLSSAGAECIEIESPKGNSASEYWYKLPNLKEYSVVEAKVTAIFNDDTPTGLDEIADGQLEARGVHYVNLQGMTSSRPFPGMNIVVTTWTDGSVTRKKVMY